MAVNLIDRLSGVLAKATSAFAPWHKWTFLVAIPTLAGLRTNLRVENLFNTQTQPIKLPDPTEDVINGRTADGSFNALDDTWMGMAGARFGRNVPIARTFGETGDRLMQPNPRLISNKLLARDKFVPVGYLNVFVSSWLQFMVHDWLNHTPGDTGQPPLEVPLPPGDSWPVDPMQIHPSVPDAVVEADEGRPSAYVNTETHWWDGSQIYGSSLKRQLAVRRDPATGETLPDGKLYLDARGHLPMLGEADGLQSQAGVFPNQEMAGFNSNWWLGLSAMHTIFAREHNCVIDRLKIEYPEAEAQWLFQKARLVVTALIAKIHTTEWTTALMNSSQGRFIMRTNWWGLTGEHLIRGYGRLNDSEIVSGEPGSVTEQHGVPYSMTEEFAACYRMHPLLPDELEFRSHQDDHKIKTINMLDMVHDKVRPIYDDPALTFDDVIYTLATSHPGLLTLRNYPNALRTLPNPKAEGGGMIDLAAIDILRDRERGVPRYCEFRRQLGMTVPKRFEDLTTDASFLAAIKEVYEKVEDVDFLVGTLSEASSKTGLPPEFGFSDTVFRIFILMASRRLQSDRFYTSDFTPQMYTPVGFAWVAENSFRTVLERHFPTMKPLFGELRNVFFPWDRAAK